jgi:1,2-dihydroxy-3-keto-5-methylthiopentene dioxygenase
MSKLRIYREDAPTEAVKTLTELADIQRELGAIGVLFERWEASQPLASDASQADVLDAYRSSIDRLTAQFGFTSVDVISVAPDHPQKAAMRDKFLHEHTHADFEVRFFVGGQGMFYIRSHAHVYAMLCCAGDLISVPAQTTHWFDMGTEPSLKAIRLFTTPEGWVATFTGDPIASRFPSMDTLEP